MRSTHPTRRGPEGAGIPSPLTSPLDFQPSARLTAMIERRCLWFRKWEGLDEIDSAALKNSCFRTCNSNFANLMKRSWLPKFYKNLKFVYLLFHIIGPKLIWFCHRKEWLDVVRLLKRHKRIQDRYAASMHHLISYTRQGSIELLIQSKNLHANTRRDSRNVCRPSKPDCLFSVPARIQFGGRSQFFIIHYCVSMLKAAIFFTM